MHIRAGSRGSKLAIAQTESVLKAIVEKHPDITYEIVVIHTKGDRNRESLSVIGGNGLFVREIEQELADGKIDLAVHSMKDLPSSLHPDLMITSTLRREEAQDVLILNHGTSLSDLPRGAVIATGSVRRRKQLELLRDDLEIRDIRGNIDTRIRKMKENGYDGIILAKAGLNRLAIHDLHVVDLSVDQMIPSPCQGALAIEIRKDRKDLSDLMEQIADPASTLEVQCERGFLQEMHADCHSPIAARAVVENGRITMHAMYGNETLYRTVVSGTDADEVIHQAANAIRAKMAGKVSLVGAGPGDPEYITIKGLKAIQDSDCIIYDRLIPAKLLEQAKPDCEMIYVGKADHMHTMKQAQINALLYGKAMHKRHVVRLKGGDVFVLGRGQEEVSYLSERGIDCEVITGISSCIAGPASVGIPLTERGICSGFRVISAHRAKENEKQMDYRSIAGSDDTTVFMMGLSHLQDIVKGLLEAGMDENMPVAVVSNATTPYMQSHFSTLKKILHETVSLPSPGMIIVGRCVNFHHVEMKTGNTGRELYLPKIGHGQTKLKEMLEGFVVHEVVVSEIHYLDYENDVIPDIAVFTSRNGVEGFFAGLKTDIRRFSNTVFACVGKATAQALSDHGIHADYIPEVSDSEHLTAGLNVKQGAVICHYTALGMHTSVPDARSIAVYENRETEVLPMRVKDDAEIIFTCSSNAERMMKRLVNADAWAEHGKAYVIGASTYRTCQKLGIRHIIQAEEATLVSLKEAVQCG
ncbi:MAG: hydroxymethylbilane synthase [Bulleidia sp.]